MRVLLLANHTPQEHPIGGVQTWMKTIGVELLLRGHYVNYASPKNPPPRSDYDLAIVSHASLTADIAKRSSKTQLGVSHGIIDPEKPLKKTFNTVYVSEEARRHWKGGKQALIIRQPLTLDYWKPDLNIDRLPMLVLHSYRCRNLAPFMELAKTLRLEFRQIKDMHPDTVRRLLQKATVVCSSGRAALEAMACGAPTMIYDHRDYESEPRHVYDIRHAQEANYSGRGDQCELEKDMAARVAIRYGNRRDWIAQHHDVRDIVERLLHASGVNPDRGTA